MLSHEIALDLGSSAFRIYVDGKGLVLNEPAYAAIDSKGKIIATGKDAYSMIGRTAAHIGIENPFKMGVINNYPLAEYMLVSAIKKVTAGKLVLPGAVLSIPSDISDVDRRALSDIIEEAGIRKIDFVENAVAAAIGASIDPFAQNGSMVIDIGELKTNAAVFAGGETITEKTINIGGRDFTHVLMSYIKKKYEMDTGYLSAENLKCEIGSAVPRDRLVTGKISGKNYKSGRIAAAIVSSDESLEAFSSLLLSLAAEISDMMIDVPVAVAGDVAISGAVLTGGGAMLEGMDRLLSGKLGFAVRLCDSPREAVINGTAGAMRIIERHERK